MVDVAVRRDEQRKAGASVFENNDIRAMVEWPQNLTE
jgi:hypothetical protein